MVSSGDFGAWQSWDVSQSRPGGGRGAARVGAVTAARSWAAGWLPLHPCSGRPLQGGRVPLRVQVLRWVRGWGSRWGCSVEVGGCEWGALGGPGGGRDRERGAGGVWTVLLSVSGPSQQEPPFLLGCQTPWAVPWALVTNLFHYLLTWAINCSWWSMAPQCPCSPGRRPACPAATGGPDPVPGRGRSVTSAPGARRPVPGEPSG